MPKQEALSDEEILKDPRYKEFLKFDYYLWHGFTIEPERAKKMEALAKTPEYQRNGKPIASKIGLAVYKDKTAGGAKIAGTSYFKYCAQEKMLIEKFRTEMGIGAPSKVKKEKPVPVEEPIPAEEIENPYATGEYLKFRDMYRAFMVQGFVTGSTEEIERLKEGLHYFWTRPGEVKVSFSEEKRGDTITLRIS